MPYRTVAIGNAVSFALVAALGLAASLWLGWIALLVPALFGLWCLIVQRSVHRATPLGRWLWRRWWVERLVATLSIIVTVWIFARPLTGL